MEVVVECRREIVSVVLRSCLVKQYILLDASACKLRTV
jgi:hypothetical protein